MCKILKQQALESSITESPKSLIFTSVLCGLGGLVG